MFKWYFEYRKICTLKHWSFRITSFQFSATKIAMIHSQQVIVMSVWILVLMISVSMILTLSWPGFESDRGASSAPVVAGRQESASLVHQGAQAEGHLPHPQPLQPRRHSEVSHRRVLVPRRRPRPDQVSTTSRNGELMSIVALSRPIICSVIVWKQNKWHSHIVRKWIDQFHHVLYTLYISRV